MSHRSGKPVQRERLFELADGGALSWDDVALYRRPPRGRDLALEFVPPAVVFALALSELAADAVRAALFAFGVVLATAMMVLNIREHLRELVEYRACVERVLAADFLHPRGDAEGRPVGDGGDGGGR